MTITSKYLCEKYNGKWAMFLVKQLEVGRITNISIDHVFNIKEIKYVQIWTEINNKIHYDIYYAENIDQYLQYITNDFLILKYIPNFLNKKIEHKIKEHKNDIKKQS